MLMRCFRQKRFLPCNQVLVRELSFSKSLRINPLIPIPIDPTESVSTTEDDKKKEDDAEEKNRELQSKSVLKYRQKKSPITRRSSRNSGNNGGNKGGNTNSGDKSTKDNGNGDKKRRNGWKDILSLFKKCTETGMITFASLGVLVLGGIIYHKLYKQNVLWKMGDSFTTNGSLLLTKHQLSNMSSDKELWAERKNQELVDSIISGKTKGKYYLLVGEKGTGKTSTVLESISRVEGEDCAIVDCSSDVELMRLRIGNALNFEFFEDYIGSLFSMKGPRESTPILDIERAFMKLEKILVKRKLDRINKPLVLVFNNSHLIDSSLVELLQQKAENFSSAGMMTMVFISDDYWLFEKFKTFATRLQVIDFEDTKLHEASRILKSARLRYFNKSVDEEMCESIFSLIGGRPQHLSHVASQDDMIKACHILIDQEKLWFLNNCALLGADMDDDVMESGKFSTSAMLLMRELVEMDRVRQKRDKTKDIIDVSHLPELPLWRARQVMTRPDHIKKYDELNIFTIGTNANVRADSVPMMRAFHEIASDPEFDDILRETIDRISEIESLGRTRELVLKDLALGGKIRVHNDLSHTSHIVSLDGGTRVDEDDETNYPGSFDDKEGVASHDYHEGERKKWWKRRLEGYSHYDNAEVSKGMSKWKTAKEEKTMASDKSIISNGKNVNSECCN